MYKFFIDGLVPYAVAKDNLQINLITGDRCYVTAPTGTETNATSAACAIYSQYYAGLNKACIMFTVPVPVTEVSQDDTLGVYWHEGVAEPVLASKTMAGYTRIFCLTRDADFQTYLKFENGGRLFVVDPAVDCRVENIFRHAEHLNQTITEKQPIEELWLYMQDDKPTGIAIYNLTNGRMHDFFTGEELSRSRCHVVEYCDAYGVADALNAHLDASLMRLQSFK